MLSENGLRGISLLLFLASFALYLWHLSACAVWGDSAELATSSYFLLPAHTPGYPLYIIIARGFCFLPFGNIAFRVNLMSAFFGALTVALFPIVGRVFGLEFLEMLVSSLALFTCPIFWMESLRAEVYTLNAFFMAIILFLMVKITLSTSPINQRMIHLFAFIFGLSLAHHLSTLFCLPLLVWILVKKKEKKWLAIAFFILLGFSSISFVAFRGLIDSPFIRADLTNYKILFKFVTGSQFKWQIFNFPVWWQNFKDYLALTANSFPWVFTIFLLVGFGGKKGLMWILALLFFLCHLSYCIVYQIPDIYELYLPSYLILALWCGVGAGRALGMIKPEFHSAKKALAFIFLLLCIGSAFSNYQQLKDCENPIVDFSNYTLPAQYSFHASNFIPQNSHIIADWKRGTLFLYRLMVEERNFRFAENVYLYLPQESSKIREKVWELDFSTLIFLPRWTEASPSNQLYSWGPFFRPIELPFSKKAYLFFDEILEINEY